ncbi:hypothetical protein MTO96_031454 [Rhipicephalus appendiculatus]
MQDTLGHDNFDRACVTHWSLGLRYRRENGLLVDFVIVKGGRLVGRATYTTWRRVEKIKRLSLKSGAIQHSKGAIAHWNKNTPENVLGLSRKFDLSWTKDFGTVRVSNVLSNMSRLGRYSLLSTNCQQSMKKLLAELTLQMPPGLKTLGETIDDAGAELFEHEED